MAGTVEVTKIDSRLAGKEFWILGCATHCPLLMSTESLSRPLSLSQSDSALLYRPHFQIPIYWAGQVTHRF